MRVLTWSHLPPSADSAYWFWLKEGMAAAGHELIGLDILGLLSLYGQHGMERVLLYYANAYAIDAVLVLPGNFVSPALLDLMRRSGWPVVALSYDDGIWCAPGMIMPDRLTWQYYSLLFAHCDLVTTVCRGTAAVSRYYGQPEPAYIPLPYAASTVHPPDDAPQPVIRYLGSPRYVPGREPSFRLRVITALRDAGLPLELHHAGWADVPGFAALARPTPSLPDLFRLARTATVTLSLPSHFLADAHPMINAMNVELAAAGALQVTCPSVEVADLFGDDGVVYAATPEAVVAAARRYLAQPGESRRLGDRAREILLRDRGWGRWWQAVAERLGDRGIRLDLAAPPKPLVAGLTPVLGLVANALAHLHEGEGHSATAAHYFQEALRYDADDAGALAGMARLAEAETGPAAYGAWRRAFQVTKPVYTLYARGRFGSRALGEWGTNGAAEAGMRWLDGACRSGDDDEIAAAGCALAPLLPMAGALAARALMARGQWPRALACLEAALAVEASAALYRLRSQVQTALGDDDRAAQDLAEAARLDALPAIIL